MSDDFYTTKVTVEVTVRTPVRTQFGHGDAINLIKALLQVPAVEKVEVKEVLTNTSATDPWAKPSKDFRKVQP